MEKLKSYLKIMIYMKDNGIIIKLMDLDYIHIIQELIIKDIGKIIYNMELESKNGMMEVNIKVIHLFIYIIIIIIIGIWINYII